jgi:hypothetical protein
MDAFDGAIKTTSNEVNRHIATLLAMAGKSIPEVEAEIVGLQPELHRLRGIRQRIVNFLGVQTANLQDRLVIAFLQHVKKIDSELPPSLEKFDLTDITTGSMVGNSITHGARPEENEFAKKVERCVGPPLRRVLERSFAEWRQGVVKNEMQAVLIDVDNHLREEAAEYQRVMREIEEHIGIHGSPLQVQELVDRWLGQGEGGRATKFQPAGIGVFGDLDCLLTGIAGDVVLEILAHLTAVWTPTLGSVFSAAHSQSPQPNTRQQIRETIVPAIREGLATAHQTEAAKIRLQVSHGFEGLKNNIAGNIDEEIAMLDAGLQTMLDRKKENEFSAEKEKARLDSSRKAITAAVSRIHAALLTV